MNGRPWLGKLLLASILAAVGSTACVGQDIVGRVADARTGAPLPGVNVYISGTTIGAATLDDGTFVISGTTPGVQDLVASMVGYEAVVRRITVEDGTLSIPQIRLSESVFDTGEVVVSSERPKDWDRHLSRFVREFLGRSPNADECEILNPFVLDFEHESAVNRLTASATRPLEIVNRALGYRISFVLEDFEVANWTYSIRFRGQPRFEELEPQDSSEETRWAENRERAYRGSLQHFLYSFSRGLDEDEGFKLGVGEYSVSDPDRVDLLPSPERDSILVGAANSYERLFYSPEPIHVTFEPETESDSYRRFMTEVTGGPYFGRSQHSVLVFDRAVTVHTSGYLYEPYAVTTYGYWVWERVADMLPRDYKPPGSSSLSSTSEG